MNQCPKCGLSHDDNQAFCLRCGAYLSPALPTSSLDDGPSSPGEEITHFRPSPNAPPPPTAPAQMAPAYPAPPKNEITRKSTAVCAIVFGGLGIHSLILKKPVQTAFFVGVFLLATLTDREYLLSITGAIAIMQGIRMLCLTDEEFDEIYVNPILPPTKPLSQVTAEENNWRDSPDY